MRRLKASVLKERYDLFFNNRKPLEYEVIHNAVVNPYEHEEDVVRKVNEDEEVKCEDKTVLFAGRLNPHWGHFIMDSLSSLWLAFQPDAPKFDEIVFVLTECKPAELHPNIKHTLELTGLTNRLRFVSEESAFSTVIIPQAAVEPRDHFAEESLAVYDAVAAEVDAKNIPTYGDKIFMSRRRFKKGILNEPDSEWVDSFFVANGYKVIYPETMDVAELIAALRSAVSVAALSGTLPHNMIFARPQTELIIIEKTPGINNYQQGVDLIRNLRVSCVDANALVNSIDPGLGPFIIYPNGLMRRFCADRGFKECPDEWNEKRRKKVLRKFFRLYKRHYSRQWILPEWMECEIGLLREAYADTMRDFGKWVSGKYPLYLTDWLYPRQAAKYLKRLIVGK